MSGGQSRYLWRIHCPSTPGVVVAVVDATTRIQNLVRPQYIFNKPYIEESRLLFGPCTIIKEKSRWRHILCWLHGVLRTRRPLPAARGRVRACPSRGHTYTYTTYRNTLCRVDNRVSFFGRESALWNFAV
ncbi:hypothetical protein EVAR_13140_1 [Eumeta japonica]|uniref:Uncharacterized protein n=1 Tax=Eumeta variegata TaxID=151549 RepID=A0A4C1UAI3_EUMVA|nr:hypothetical protein EVAR_13140_1 [Eumeta japonica]